jgi:hypothetical protein
MRIGVVGVVEDRQAGGLDQLAAPARQDELAEGPSARHRIEAELFPDGPRQHRVGGEVAARIRQVHLLPSRRERHPSRRIDLQVPRLPLGGLEAGRDDPARQVPRAVGKRGRVGSHDRERHVARERKLFPQHTLDGPEPFEVAGRHIGDHGDRRVDDLAVARDLARQVCACLDDQRIGVVRRLEDGERDADQVVQVGAGRVHAEPCPQHGRDHLLRAGLPVRAGDRHDGAGDLPPACVRERAVCVKGIVHLDQLEPGHRGRAAPHDGGRGPPFGRRTEMRVPVEALTVQCHEERARRECPRVGRDVREARARRCCRQRQGAPYELRAPAHQPATRPRTISRSSNGSFSVPMTW